MYMQAAACKMSTIISEIKSLCVLFWELLDVKLIHAAVQYAPCSTSGKEVFTHFVCIWECRINHR